MVTPRDLAVATWVTGKSLIESVGETVTALSLSVLSVPKLVLALTTGFTSGCIVFFLC